MASNYYFIFIYIFFRNRIIFYKHVYKLQVSLLTAVLFLFGTLCLADGKANYGHMSVYIKHFTRNHHDVGIPIMGLQKMYV